MNNIKFKQYYGQKIKQGFVEKQISLSDEIELMISDPEQAKTLNFVDDIGNEIKLLEVLNDHGGEGVIYKTQYPLMVAKILNKEHRTKSRENKINLLSKNNPNCDLFCWPSNLIYYNDTFVGFVMPYCEGIELKKLENNPRKYIKKYNISYTRINQIDIILSILNAFKSIHEIGAIVGDVKLENIVLNYSSNNSIKLVDIDSIQVDEFPCITSSPGYDSPEVINRMGLDICKKNSDNHYEFNSFYQTYYRSLSHDQHAINVLLYKLLIGYNPYNCSDFYNETPDDQDDEDVRIASEHRFAYGLTEGETLGTATKGLTEWSYLPSYIKEAFILAFTKLHRFSDEDWILLFKKYKDDLESRVFNDDLAIHDNAASFDTFKAKSSMADILKKTVEAKGFVMQHAIARIVKSLNDYSLIRRVDEIADALKHKPVYNIEKYNFTLVYNIGILKKVKAVMTT